MLLSCLKTLLDSWDKVSFHRDSLTSVPLPQLPKQRENWREVFQKPIVVLGTCEPQVLEGSGTGSILPQLKEGLRQGVTFLCC